MKMDAINPIFIIAKKEIMDNIRNKWIITMSIIFALLTLVTSYFGSIFSTGWQDLGATISGMMVLVQFLVPIIALILGYATIIGEIERGSMSSLLSQSITRLEILLGKFLGLGSILAFTIFIGFGIAGIVIALNVPDVNFVNYLVFIGSTIIIGLIFLSISVFFSTIFKKRTSAIGGAIFLWFLFNMILPMVLAGVLFTVVGLEKGAAILSGLQNAPMWYYLISLLNPLSIYGTFNILTLDISMQPGTVSSFPDFFSGELMILLMIVWIIFFQLLAFWRFNKKDI
ncbi:MAG: ABC transporter permease [Thermoplasmatales archaeon]|nr:ABC transporter permease [Thermoplasmatales archaeon]